MTLRTKSRATVIAIAVAVVLVPAGWVHPPSAGAVTAPSTIESLPWSSRGLDIGPDDVIYRLADTTVGEVWKHHPDGTATLLATGSGHCDPTMFPQAGPNAMLCVPQDLALAPDGSMVVLNMFGIGLVRVGPNGFVVPISESPRAGSCTGLDVDSTGHIYVWGGGGVQKLTPQGAVVWVAEVGASGSACDIAVAPDGDVYAARNYQVFRIGQGGTVTVFAGTGENGFSGDGGAAVDAQLGSVFGLAVDGSGTVFMADYGNRRVRMVESDGTISTVAGDGTADCVGDGGPPSAAHVGLPRWLASNSDGDLYLAAPAWFSFAGCSTRKITRRAGLHGVLTAGGVPEAGRLVSVFADWPSWEVLGQTTTAADGSWRIDDLPVRPYRVRYFDPTWQRPLRWHGDAVTYRSAPSVAVTVDSDTALDYDWAPADTSGRVTGQLVTDGSTPAAGIVVLAVHTDGVARGARTGPSGYFNLPGLVPGAYRLVFFDPTMIHPLRWYDDAPDHQGSATINVTAGSAILIAQQHLP